MKAYVCCLFTSLTAALPSLGRADDRILPEGLQLHGFLSQGYVQTSANRWFGDSEQGSWDFREIGINASYRPARRWLVSAQVLSRTAGDMDDGSLRLDYGLLDWGFEANAERRLGLRLGRIKNPAGFYNETRDVAFTRPAIFLPQAVYFDRVRNLALSADGAQIYGDWSLEGANLSLRIGMGMPLINKAAEATFMGRDWQGSLKADRPLVITRLGYETGDRRLRLALSGITVRMDFERGPADPPPPLLDSGHIDLTMGILSAQYNSERWSLTGEYLLQGVNWVGTGRLPPGYNLAQGWYLQGEWRPRDDLSLFLRYDDRITNLDDPNGTDAEAARGIPAHNGFAHDWVLGGGWTPRSDLLVRLEYHWVDGTAWLSNEENDPRSTTRRWQMFAAQVSFRF